MFVKILLITATVAIASGRPQDHGHHGHDEGHAFSSQSIVLHQSHATKHEPHHVDQGHEEHHGHESAVHHEQKGHEEHHDEHHVDYYAHPKYEFAYEIKDPHTHDQKSHHEHRDGDNVKGVYSLHQPDGTIRIVEYYADKKTGFHANVKYIGHAKHIVPEHKHH